jgi:hypothetical protein
MEADMTHDQLLNRAQVFFDLAASVAARVYAAIDYISFLLVADDSMPIFPGEDISLQG